MQTVNLFPGSMGLVGLCCDLLGVEKVVPNAWLEPVTLVDVSQKDIDVIVELARGQGVDIRVHPLNRAA